MKAILKFTFIKTIPVLVGYLFMGIAFGLLLEKAGYNFVWAFFISTVVYAGSMQFVLISFLGADISIVSVILMTLSINSRHMFYGLSFIEFFKKMGKVYPYMIFSLTDETYSLLCGTKVPDNLDSKKTFFSIAFINHLYWVFGSVIGAGIGQLIIFNSEGVEFAMTALFVVIFIEQWISSNSRLPQSIGIFCGVVCLISFGPGNFILPALISCISILLILNKFEKKKPTIPIV